LSHVFIVEDDLLTDKVDEFDLIVLPYMPLLSIQKQNALITYVNNGGNLIVVGPSGSKNQYALPNETIPLLKAAGLSGYPGQNVSKAIGKGRIQFIPLIIPDHKYLTKYEQKEGTTFGSSMVDVFADVPEAYTRNNIHPELRDKLAFIADQSVTMLNSNVTMIKDGSPFVEISEMRKDDEHILLHLVNYNVTVDGDITAARNINVQIAVPQGKKINTIMYNGSLGEMKPLEFTVNEDGFIEVDFPNVNIYGLARITFM
jgi:hypothetical protein